MKQGAGRGDAVRWAVGGAWRMAAMGLGLALAACSSTGPGPAESGAPAAAAGHGWIYALRENQDLYSLTPVTLSIDGRTIGTLARGTYRSVEVPAGQKSLTVSALLSRLTTRFDLDAGATAYVLIATQPSGLPAPRGAVGAAPLRGASDQQGLFSVQFLDEPSAKALLAKLQPAQ
jgi:hypothetical protein